MSNKKSFILHIDSLDILEKLTDEQSGKLLKAMMDYHKGNDLNLDPLIDIAFTPFKNQFARDGEKYKKLCEKNKLIAEKRYARNATKSTSGNEALPDCTKSTDNDSDNDSDSKSDSDNKRSILAESQIPVDELISIYNEECNALPKVVTYNKKQKRISQLKARWNEDKDRQSLDWWREFFKWCNTNESLNGSKFDWIADLEAITNQSKFTRLIEKGTL